MVLALPFLRGVLASIDKEEDGWMDGWIDG